MLRELELEGLGPFPGAISGRVTLKGVSGTAWLVHGTLSLLYVLPTVAYGGCSYEERS